MWRKWILVNTMCVDFDSLVTLSHKEEKKSFSCLYQFCKDILVHECLRKCSSAQTNQTCRTNQHENSMYTITIINSVWNRTNSQAFCPLWRNSETKWLLSPPAYVEMWHLWWATLHDRLQLHPVSVGEGRTLPSSPSGLLPASLWDSSSLPRLASPPGGAVQHGHLLKPLLNPSPRPPAHVSQGRSLTGLQHCGCRPNTMARRHTNPGFMDDLKHLGQPFVPFVCRHLRKQCRWSWMLWNLTTITYSVRQK